MDGLTERAAGESRFRLDEYLEDPDFRRGFEAQRRVTEAAREIYDLRGTLGLEPDETARLAGCTTEQFMTAEGGFGEFAPTASVLEALRQACDPSSRSRASTMSGTERALKPPHLRPMNDYVLIRRGWRLTLVGSLIIPDTVAEKPMEGVILAVGPGSRNEYGVKIALELQVGDRVLFEKWSGSEVRFGGEELLLVQESRILGVVDGHDSRAARVAA